MGAASPTRGIIAGGSPSPIEDTINYVTISTLGPVGDVVEEWRLRGAFCLSANFGDMDWSSDAPANISITIAMDYAILNY